MTEHCTLCGDEYYARILPSGKMTYQRYKIGEDLACKKCYDKIPKVKERRRERQNKRNMECNLIRQERQNYLKSLPVDKLLEHVGFYEDENGS